MAPLSAPRERPTSIRVTGDTSLFSRLELRKNCECPVNAMKEGPCTPRLSNAIAAKTASQPWLESVLSRRLWITTRRASPRANRTTASALAGELTGRTVGWKTLASSPRGRRMSRVVIRQVDTASKRLFARWHLTLRSGAPKQILNQGPGEAQQARLP
jgi:hypothetical protein